MCLRFILIKLNLLAIVLFWFSLSTITYGQQELNSNDYPIKYGDYLGDHSSHGKTTVTNGVFQSQNTSLIRSEDENLLSERPFFNQVNGTKSGNLDNIDQFSKRSGDFIFPLPLKTGLGITGVWSKLFGSKISEYDGSNEQEFSPDFGQNFYTPTIPLFRHPITSKPEIIEDQQFSASEHVPRFGHKQIKRIRKLPNDLTASATSNSYDSKPAPQNSPSSSSYSYGPSSAIKGKTRYGYRNNPRGNMESEFTGSQYDDYDQNYNRPHADNNYSDSYDNNIPASSDEYRQSPTPPHSSQQSSDYKQSPPSSPPSSSHQSKYSQPSYSQHDYYDRDRDVRPRYPSRPRYRNRYPIAPGNNWNDFNELDAGERGWLSSLFGGYKWRPSRYRLPMALSSTEAISLANIPPGLFEANGLGLLRGSPFSNPAWYGYGYGQRPAASSLRPTYSFANLLGYGRQNPQIQAFSPYQSFYGFGGIPSASSFMPIKMRPYGYSPSMMTSASLSYPIKMPYNPFLPVNAMMRPTFPYRPQIFPPNDLAFAESFRNPNTSDNMEGAASKNLVSFAAPPAIKVNNTDKESNPVFIKSFDAIKLLEESFVSSTPSTTTTTAKSKDRKQKESLYSYYYTSSTTTEKPKEDYKDIVARFTYVSPRSAFKSRDSSQTWVPIEVKSDHKYKS